MVCDSFVAPSGAVYHQSGQYQDVIQNADGCDSIIDIDLTVNQSAMGQLSVTVCDTFIAPSGAVLTLTGLYSDTIQNASGCDSVISIDLTIKQSSYAAFTVSECGSYTAPSGAVYTSSGTYIDIISNAEGCDSILTFYVTINPSPIVQLEFVADLEFCDNSAQVNVEDYVNVAGGVMNIEGFGTTSTTIDPQLLSAGTYNVDYYIDSGCYLPTSGTLTVFEAPSINLENKILNNSCSGNTGYLEMSVSTGSSSFYDFAWSTGETQSLSIADLPNGIYSLDVLDSNGCEARKVEQITTVGVTVSQTKSDVSCYGGTDGTVSITGVQGLSGNLQYLWSNGQSGTTATNLPAGTHFCVIQDATGCQMNHIVQITQPAPLSMTTDPISPDCGQSNGSLSVTVSGGTPNYTYQWDATGSTSNEILQVGYGVYTVTVTDDKACVLEQAISLNEKDAPILEAIVSKSGCQVNNGAIDLVTYPNGGPGQFTYEWNDQVTTEDRTNLSPDVYRVEANDVNGCKSVGQWEIVVRPPLKNNICVVTVDSATTTNLVVWERRELQGIDYYNIYRESVQSGEYLKIDQVDDTEVSVFNDVVASPAATSWRYRISAVNVCGVEGPLSGVHRTIHTTHEELSAHAVRVTWNHYQGASYTEYIVFRYTDLDGYKAIDTVSATQTSLVDFPPSLEGLDYTVGFDLNTPCTATGKAEDFRVSRSNRTSGVFNPGFGTGQHSNNTVIEHGIEDYQVRLYPNPVSNDFVVSIEGHQWLDFSITDARGRLVQQGALLEGDNHLQSINWEHGVYFLNLRSGKEAHTVRFVK